MVHNRRREVLSVVLAASLLCGCHAVVRISEVADKGSSGVCSGDDWVELCNDGDETVDLTGYILHDDKGADDEDALTFSGSSTTIAAGAFLLLCKDATGSFSKFSFGIGKSDTITLLDAGGLEVSTSGELGGSGAFDKTWMYVSESEDTSFEYTFTPTPGAENSLTDEAAAFDVLLASLVEQNEQGACINPFHLSIPL